MSCFCTPLTEWFRSHFSAVATFQKDFVDDMTEKVKERKAQFDRHTREARDRAVHLHLDALEEKFLCCVCRRGGEPREDEEHVYDFFSMVNLPSRRILESAVEEELADEEVQDERIRQLQRNMAAKRRHEATTSSGYLSRQATNLDYADESDLSSSSSESPKNGRLEQQTATANFDASPPQGTHAPERNNGASRLLDSDTALAVMNPDMVGPLEVRNTMYKIRHAVLHREARTRRKATAVHRDKGLMMIEESEIDMFSHFFQRPVHGYLCLDCYGCARRRLDTLTEQIRTILFRADHPLLRKVPVKELEGLISGKRMQPSLISAILAVQMQWAEMTDEQRQEHGGMRQKFASAQGSGMTSNDFRDRSEMTSLSERSILSLRERVRCGACQRRRCCFFERKSVVFLCQFCTARDRFYRDHAVCINDEPMPVSLAQLLNDLAVYYESLHQQQELRQVPQSVIEKAETDLFPPIEVLEEDRGLFRRQHLTQEPSEQVVVPLYRAETLVRPLSQLSGTVAGAALSAAESAAAASRDVVGRTMISLFDGVEVRPDVVNLFATTGKTAARQQPVQQAIPVDTAPMETKGGLSFVSGASPSQPSGTTSVPSPTTVVTADEHNGDEAVDDDISQWF